MMKDIKAGDVIKAGTLLRDIGMIDNIITVKKDIEVKRDYKTRYKEEFKNLYIILTPENSLFTKNLFEYCNELNIFIKYLVKVF
jgi:hypothetical protein